MKARYEGYVVVAVRVNVEIDAIDMDHASKLAEETALHALSWDLDDPRIPGDVASGDMEVELVDVQEVGEAVAA